MLVPATSRVPSIQARSVIVERPQRDPGHSQRDAVYLQGLAVGILAVEQHVLTSVVGRRCVIQMDLGERHVGQLNLGDLPVLDPDQQWNGARPADRG